ncbi:glutaredoxin-related protein 5, mitochondrial-like [Daphnia pulex]|uniref:glutaredoxin-related protein 5, mitochondrial-like n=1 Tax=Daphnia pulex TaxID=6669 RepID=UPI001EDD4A16|nr:glutaredoxin-related protein 5, mitochondrial-like [Daphnia pulex]XP_046654118.1 glutaredoxin-related protein 5, mitochondrial-like [Daphnia pulicaria]
MTGVMQKCSKVFLQAAVLNRPISIAYLCTVSPKDQYEQMVKKNKVVVFMKGVPEQPMCGFSNAVVQIFRMHGVTNYDAHNVLADESIRQGIKEFTNWPTIPQIFIGGEFVGGCDILLQMHKNGELIEELQKVGIQSALLEQEKKEE